MVAILHAVYNPDIPWLITLLDSLNRQTYQDLCLYVRDDASPNMSLQELDELLRTHVTSFPYVLNRNEQNLGSNKTFEALVRECSEPYIAFCDQDDIWLPEKIEKTFRLLQDSPLHPTLVCTDVKVIDGEGNEIAPSMEKHRRRHVFLRGTNLASTLIYRNFVMGCTILMERERALAYLPFPDAVVHDHYLAFRAACDGAIDYLSDPQILYRVYGGNQTGVMTGVTSKEDYLRRRIRVFEARVDAFFESADFPALEQAREWTHARINNFYRKRGGFASLLRLRKVNSATSLFELTVLRLPQPLFRFAIKLVQKRIL